MLFSLGKCFFSEIVFYLYPMFTDGRDLPANFHFPFKKDCIDMITMQVIKRADGTFIHTGWISYRNHGTIGRQEFSAKDLPLLIKQIGEFIETMK